MQFTKRELEYLRDLVRNERIALERCKRCGTSKGIERLMDSLESLVDKLDTLKDLENLKEKLDTLT